MAGRLKLIDFGIASAVMSDKTSVMIDNQMGTFNFMSPESIQDLNPPQSGKPRIKISFKSDVWSLGCILYNLTYGKMPFGDIKHPLMKLQAIQDTKHQIPFPPLEKEDQVLTSLIKSCLIRDPAIRPSIVQLLQHQVKELTNNSTFCIYCYFAYIHCFKLLYFFVSMSRVRRELCLKWSRRSKVRPTPLIRWETLPRS